MSAPRVVIIGHVEWVTHALGTPPAPGHIADLSGAFAEPAGGGGVAAVAAARLGADVHLLTALGNDEAADASADDLTRRGVQVAAAPRNCPQTPVLTITEGDGERTIMVVGPRLQAREADGMHDHALADAMAAYYAGEDPHLLARARAAVANLVVTGRRIDDLVAAGVRADVVVASANDPDEDPSGLPPGLAPTWTVLTDGARGGTLVDRAGNRHAYAAAAAPAPVIDTYGCGDSFAAGITVGLARGLDIDDAIAVGAAAGAACATWRGGLGPA